MFMLRNALVRIRRQVFRTQNAKISVARTRTRWRAVMLDQDPGRSRPQPAECYRQVQVGDRFLAVHVVRDTTGIMRKWGKIVAVSLAVIGGLSYIEVRPFIGPAFADEKQALVPYAPTEYTGVECPALGPCTSEEPPSTSSTMSDAKAEQAFALRLQHRLSGRLSLDLNMGIDLFKHNPGAGPPFPVARILFGYRKNVTPGMGFHVRGGPMLGIPISWNSDEYRPSGTSDVETRWMTGVAADGLLVIGPFGRFFFGPLVCFDYARFSDTIVHNAYPTVHLHNGFTAGGGFDIGGVFGAREQMVIYQSLRMTAGTGESMIFLLFGISFLR